MYTISYPSSTIRLVGVIVQHDDSDPDYQIYRAWLVAGNGPEMLQDATEPRCPIQINAWQIRSALNMSGLRAAVEAAVAAGSQMLKDGWEHSPTFTSDHPLTLGMGMALGQGEDAMYALFELGESL